MQHFSQEHLDKLVAEHRLISATIQQLNAQGHRYIKAHGASLVGMAADDLKVKRVQLEAMIDVLGEYLN